MGKRPPPAFGIDVGNVFALRAGAQIFERQNPPRPGRPKERPESFITANHTLTRRDSANDLLECPEGDSEKNIGLHGSAVALGPGAVKVYEGKKEDQRAYYGRGMAVATFRFAVGMLIGLVGQLSIPVMSDDL